MTPPPVICAGAAKSTNRIAEHDGRSLLTLLAWTSLEDNNSMDAEDARRKHREEKRRKQ
jgi:hypothetical protein